MKRCIFCLIVITIFSCTPLMKGLDNVNVKSAHAGGIPVIDVAHISQTMVNYLTRLGEYSEAIATTASNAEQYNQMLQEYMQMLQEYQHYLNQLESLKNIISDPDWDLLMQVIDSYYGRSERSLVQTMDPNSSSYESDLDTILEKYGYIPKHPSLVKIEAQRLGIWTPQYEEQVKREYNAFELYKDQLRMVSAHSNQNKKLQKEIDKHKEILEDLGPESDLATLQALAAMQLTEMKQNRDLAQTVRETLLNQEQQEASKAAKKAKTKQIERNRLLNRKNVQPPIQDRWGRF